MSWEGKEGRRKGRRERKVFQAPLLDINHQGWGKAWESELRPAEFDTHYQVEAWGSRVIRQIWDQNLQKLGDKVLEP